MHKNRVVITGIGLLSAAGQDLKQHINLLNQDEPCGLDGANFAPFFTHRLEPIDWSQKIAKKSDLRQMSFWQKQGVFAAGLALEDANIEQESPILGYLDILAATGGGERDIAADETIMQNIANLKTKQEKDLNLNKALQQELRPTLFLAQLSNLLAGNIAINYKISGRSLSLMGEELAGASALLQAKELIETGQTRIILVGASCVSDSADMLLNYQLENLLEAVEWRPLKQRVSGPPSLILGSGAVFLVLEDEDHAKARGARIYSILKHCAVEMLDREQNNYKQNLCDFYKEHGLEHKAILACCSGAAEATKLELSILDNITKYVKSYSDKIGYLKEAQFLVGLALANLSTENYITMMGINYGEAIACLERYENG